MSVLPETSLESVDSRMEKRSATYFHFSSGLFSTYKIISYISFNVKSHLRLFSS